jgi:two-component system phosphate regulon sensor histidine kinase PhoR
MVEGVVAVDADERVVLMNDAAHRILGAGPAPAEGRPIWEVTRLVEVGETLAEASRTGAPTEREARLPRTPRDRFLRLHGAPLKDARGGPAGAVLVVHDISELRHLEMVRRDFVANVSHELKTPLAAVRGFVETILEDEAMEAGIRRRFLTKIHEQTMRLSKMVAELLTLSRVESAEFDVARAPTDLRGALRASLEAVARLAEEKVLDLRVDVPDAPALVAGNDEALRRIAGNLLDNAVKYTPPGGRVAVRIVSTDREVFLEVEDTGPGIPERDRERVFERFYRVDKGRSRDAGGTGLGLAIVKHLVRALGGAVGVEGAPSGGSLFRVRLPRVTAA